MRTQNFESHHGDVIMSKLNEDRKTDAKYCDFRIQTNGCNFPVHKNIVGPLSGFFGTMFFSEMKEQNQHQANMDGIKKDVMEFILDFFYTGFIQITRDNVYEVMEAANYLDIANLKNYCAEFLLNEVEPENCLNLMTFSKIYDRPGISDKVDDVIRNNFEDVISSDEFKTFDLEEVKALMDLKQIIPCIGKVSKKKTKQ